MAFHMTRLLHPISPKEIRTSTSPIAELLDNQNIRPIWRASSSTFLGNACNQIGYNHSKLLATIKKSEGRPLKAVGPIKAMQTSRRRPRRDRFPPEYPARPKPLSPGMEDDTDIEDIDLGDYGPGGTKRWTALTEAQEPPGGEIVLKGVNKFVLASVFVMGIGAGITMSTLVNTEPANVASRDVIDQKTPNPDICLANGFSAMVLDQRLFISFNPFNVYVSQAEVKPGCVLRQSNWQVLESRGLVNSSEVRDCKRNMNTFGFVGDLRQAPEISCVYHSETAENQFLVDPAKATLGDGFQPRDFDR